MLEKAIIINNGIDQANTSFLSIKIFFTAGSNNHAIPAVLPATIKERIRAINILLRCFLTYCLNNLSSINLNSEISF